MMDIGTHPITEGNTMTTNITYDYNGIARGFILRNQGRVLIECHACDRVVPIDSDWNSADDAQLVRLVEHAHTGHSAPVALRESRASAALSPWIYDQNTPQQPSHIDDTCGCTDPYCQA